MYLEKCESKDSLSQIGCKDTTKIAYMQIFRDFFVGKVQLCDYWQPITMRIAYIPFETIAPLLTCFCVPLRKRTVSTGYILIYAEA